MSYADFSEVTDDEVRALLASAEALSREAGRGRRTRPSEKLGNGWIVSRSTSIGTSALIASVACCSHSPASGPIATAPTTTRLTIGDELYEPRALRPLVRRRARGAVDVPRRADEAGSLERPDLGDLGIGEDDGGHGAVVGRSTMTGDVGGGDARLVLRDVREQGDPCHVADRPHVLRRLEMLVDDDALLLDRDAELLEPQAVDRRPAADRDEQARRSSESPSESRSRLPPSRRRSRPPRRA